MVEKFFLISFAIFTIAGCTHASQSLKSAARATPRLLATEDETFSKFIEGPTIANDELVYAVGFAGPHGIGKWGKGGQGVMAIDLGPKGKPQSLKLCGIDQLIGIDRGQHQVFKVDLVTQEISILLKQDIWHQPNDFAITKKGEFYFTDPVWSQSKKGAIWYWSGKLDEPAQKLFEKTNFFVNGIDLSPDEKWLYFSESMRGQIWRVDLKTNSIFQPEIWVSLAPNTVDGLKVDMAGRVWVTRIGQGIVEIYDPLGQLLSTVQLQGKEPTNLTFGGKEGRTVAVTVRDTRNIEIFSSDHPGREWLLLQKASDCSLSFAR